MIVIWLYFLASLLLAQVLKFGRIRGMPDDSDRVLYGASTLRTGAVAASRPGAAPEKISVGCLIRIEFKVESNSLRISVRTLHPSASGAIMQTAKTLLR